MRAGKGARMRALAVGMAVAAAALGAGSTSAGATEIGGHQNGLIAFVAQPKVPGGCRYNCEAIYVTDSAGTVTWGPIAWGSRPTISPDGVHVAYVDRYGLIHVTTIAGYRAGDDQIGPAGPPSWMPDGSHIVFAAGYQVDETDVFANVHPLFTVTPQPGDTDRRGIAGTSVSPDGTRVALTLITATTSTYHTEIFVANIDGSDLHQVTTTPAVATFGGDGARAPHWSPDGTKLIYSFIVSGSSKIATTSPDGGAPTVFAQPGTDPSFSPDGQQIVFANGDTGLERMNSDGSGAQPIPAGPGDGVYVPGAPGVDQPVTPSGLGVPGYSPTWGPAPHCALLGPLLETALPVFAQYPAGQLLSSYANHGVCVSATAG